VVPINPLTQQNHTTRFSQLRHRRFLSKTVIRSSLVRIQPRGFASCSSAW